MSTVMIFAGIVMFKFLPFSVLLQAPPDFQQHLQGNFGPPQRPLPSQEQWRGPPPHHQDQEHFFSGGKVK